MEEHGQVATTQVAVTGPGNLNPQIRHVIHAVGPVWNSEESESFNINLLMHTIFNTLKKANELGCASISIPAISAGIFGFPRPLCAKVHFYTLAKFVQIAQQSGTELVLRTVRLCNPDEETAVIFRCQFDCTFS